MTTTVKPKRSITLTARFVDIVALFRAGTDHGRAEPIHCVRVEPHPDGGVLILATNGHILGAIHDRDGLTNGIWNCPIPASVLAKIRRADADAWLRIEGDRVAVVPHSARYKKFKVRDAAVAKDEGESYPDFRRLLDPDMVPTVRTNFYSSTEFFSTSYNAKYIGIFAEVAARAGKMGRGNENGTHNLVIYPGAPGYVRIATLGEFFGMLMPYKNDEYLEPVMPPWMRQLAPARLKTEPEAPPQPTPKWWQRAFSWLSPATKNPSTTNA